MRNTPHQPGFHQPLGQHTDCRDTLKRHPLFVIPTTLVFLLSPFISSSPASFPYSPTFPSIIDAVHSSLMLPNTLLFHFLFHPLSFSCFVCKPQGKEIGENHSLQHCHKGLVSHSHLCSRLPPPTKNTYRKNTEITPYLPFIYRNTHTHLRASVQ